MQFEWDEAKNAANQKKHGIAFEAASTLWDGVHVEIDTIAYSEDGETRSATMGWVGDRVCVAIWTGRDDKTRLISVRRANKNEEKVFFEKLQD